MLTLGPPGEAITGWFNMGVVMVNAPATENRIYSQEDIQQILNLAIARHTYQGEFSRSQLLEIAADLGISEVMLSQAEQDWLQVSEEQRQQEIFKRLRRSTLRQKIGRFGIVNAGLLSLNALTGFESAWSLYVLCGWGLLLGLETFNTFHVEGEAYERAFQRWRRRSQVRQVVNHWLGRWLSS